MKAKIVPTSTNGVQWRWVINVLAGSGPTYLCCVKPHQWIPSHKTQDGAISTARRVANQLNLEVEE